VADSTLWENDGPVHLCKRCLNYPWVPECWNDEMEFGLALDEPFEDSVISCPAYIE